MSSMSSNSWAVSIATRFPLRSFSIGSYLLKTSARRFSGRRGHRQGLDCDLLAALGRSMRRQDNRQIVCANLARDLRRAASFQVVDKRLDAAMDRGSPVRERVGRLWIFTHHQLCRFEGSAFAEP